MSIHIHYLQNLATSGVGSVAQWAEQRGYQLSGTHLDQGDEFPLLQDIDLLVILGGVPQECAGWIEQEVLFIRQSIACGKGVLGICLGAQLIARALGGELIPHIHAESGWWPVTFRKEAEGEPLLKGIAQENTLFFFHRNTFSMPDGCRWLANSEGCEHQIFAFGDRVLGIQAHPEMLAETIHDLAINKVHTLPPGPFHALTRSDAEAEDYLAGAQTMLYRLLDNLVHSLRAT